jgi:hypothetical protein
MAYLSDNVANSFGVQAQRFTLQVKQSVGISVFVQ